MKKSANRIVIDCKDKSTYFRFYTLKAETEGNRGKALTNEEFLNILLDALEGKAAVIRSY